MKSPEVYAALLTGIVAILGSFLGSFLNSLFQNKEFRLQTRRAITDKRVTAHEGVLKFVSAMRKTMSANRADADRSIVSYVQVLSNGETWYQFQLQFGDTLNDVFHYFSPPLIRNLFFIQDYIANINILLGQNITEDQFGQLSIDVKKDFLDLSQELQNETLLFFRKGIHEEFDFKTEWHKWDKEYTQKRLSETELMRIWGDLLKL